MDIDYFQYPSEQGLWKPYPKWPGFEKLMSLCDVSIFKHYLSLPICSTIIFCHYIHLLSCTRVDFGEYPTQPKNLLNSPPFMQRATWY
jgi:hypothetical protein